MVEVKRETKEQSMTSSVYSNWTGWLLSSYSTSPVSRCFGQNDIANEFFLFLGIPPEVMGAAVTVHFCPSESGKQDIEVVPLTFCFCPSMSGFNNMLVCSLRGIRPTMKQCLCHTMHFMVSPTVLRQIYCHNLVVCMKLVTHGVIYGNGAFALRHLTIYHLAFITIIR